MSGADLSTPVQFDAYTDPYPRRIESRQDNNECTSSQAMLEFTAGPSVEDIFSPNSKQLGEPSDLLVSFCLNRNVFNDVASGFDANGSCSTPTQFSLEHRIPDIADEVVNLIGNDEGNTPLHEAVIYGRHTVVRTLIDRGADILATNVFGKTPLHLAAEFGRHNVIEILDPGQMGLDIRDKFGLTPLHLAAKAGHEQVVALLLDKGAVIDSKVKR